MIEGGIVGEGCAVWIKMFRDCPPSPHYSNGEKVPKADEGSRAAMANLLIQNQNLKITNASACVPLIRLSAPDRGEPRVSPAFGPRRRGREKKDKRER